MGGITRNLRVGGLAFALALMFVLTGSVAAGNQQSFADAAGDNERESSSVYASDIRSVALTTQDSGAATVAVTLVDFDARLVSGDVLDVYMDTDGNNSNGQSGFDFALEARGQSSGQPAFFLCSLAAPVTCEAGLSGFGSDQPTGAAGAHVVTFNIFVGSPSISFFVLATYPGSSATLRDLAPASGTFTFPVNADPDRDGLHGASDECPSTRARGIFDKESERDGCPGPFNFIRGFHHLAAIPQAGYLQLQKLWFQGQIPAGASILIRGAGRSAAGKSKQGIARTSFRGNLPYGAVITVRISKPAWVGFFGRYQVTRRGLVLKKTLCIPAQGAPKPMKCTLALRGK